MDIKELKSKVKVLIEQENILRYFDIVSKNPSISYLNQMYLFFQSKRAEVVCGRGVWVAMGREVKADADMLCMLYPAIIAVDEHKFEMKYLFVGVYALSDTVGNEISTKNTCPNLLDRIAVLTQSTPEVTDKSFSFGIYGEYDVETDIFYISKDCPNEKKNEVLLSSFIDYVMFQKKNTDKELKLALRYIMFQFFGCDITYINAKLFGLLRKRTDEELLQFFRILQFYTWEIINGLQEIPTLNFNETAFINELLCSDKKLEICNLFDRVIMSDGINEDIKSELQELRYKLSLMDDDNLQKLYIQKQRNRIYSYPVTPIRYNLMDYLKGK